MTKQLRNGVKLVIFTIIIGISSILGMTRANASTLLSFDFSQSGTGTLAKTVTYTTGSYSVTFNGLFNTSGDNSSPLYFSPSTGLGLATYTESNSQVYQGTSINGSGAVQFSTAGLTSDVSSVLLTITGTGTWTIRGSNSPGSIWGSYIGADENGSATIDLANYSSYSGQTPWNVLSTYAYITVIPESGASIYISGLSVTSTAAQNPSPTPEPSTVISLAIGLAILVPSLLKSKKSLQ